MKLELDRCDVAFGLENVVFTAIASLRLFAYKSLVQWEQVACSDWLVFGIGVSLFDICDLNSFNISYFIVFGNLNCQ